ncbi:hypothetical protein AX17_005489 [Amanita inopinata Kibby_2008]|nr:hypothetical protein AX17_005489 [Amanita inopinata Kibby_2008]
MLWTSIACLNQFVNSVVWAGNVINYAPWWCEISIRILMGASVGIPASSLCIVRRLYTISRVNAVAMSVSDKRRSIIVDSAICVLFPIIFIALQYVVQGHRFNIFEDIGCFPAIYNTLPAYFISMMWPLLIGIASAIYGGLTLYEFCRRRIQFHQFAHSHSSLTMSRYIRLIALAMTEMMFITPLAIVIIVLNATTTKIGPWISWENTHYAYSRVEQIPGFIWRSNQLLVVSMELTRWSAPFCAFVFFAFFGFAEEARKHYCMVFDTIKNKVGLGRRSPPATKTMRSQSPMKLTGLLPLFAMSPSKKSFRPPPLTVGGTTIEVISICASTSDTDQTYYVPESPLKTSFSTESIKH